MKAYQVQVTSQGKGQGEDSVVRLTLQWPWEAVEKVEQEVVEDISRVVRVDGFRPGKAPFAIVRKRFHVRVQEELTKRLLQEGIAQAVEQENLRLVSTPKVYLKEREPVKEKPFIFEAEFELFPKVELNKYKGLKLKRFSLDIEEKEVEEALKHLRERFASLEPTLETQAREGLVALVKLREVKLIVTPGESDKSKWEELVIELGKGEVVPDLEKGIVGMRVGETKKIQVTFPNKQKGDKSEGRVVSYECQLVELKKKVLPPLDDSLADQIKKGLSLAGLREEIKRQLEKEKQRQLDQYINQQISEQLLEAHSFSVPPSLIAEQQKALRRELEQRFGVKFSSLKLSEEEQKELEQRAEREVRLSFIIGEIARRENIVCTEADKRRYVEGLVKGSRVSYEEAVAHFDKKKQWGQIEAAIIHSKTLDFIRDQAQWVEVEEKLEPSRKE